MRDRVALLVRLAISIVETDRQWRSTAKWTVRVAYKRHRAGALEPARQVAATGGRPARYSFLEALVDVLTLVVCTDVSIATVFVFLTFNR